MKPGGRHLVLILPLAVALPAGAARLQDGPRAGDTYAAEVLRYRAERDEAFRTSPFSQLALIHREYLQDKSRVTIGSAAAADVRLSGEGIAATHAILERGPQGWLVKRAGNAQILGLGTGAELRAELLLRDNTGFRIAHYNLRYIEHASWGGTLEVYDGRHPNLAGFQGMDYFSVDLAYLVQVQVMAYARPQSLSLVDSQGNQRPYFLYGELHFELRGTPCRLELYTTSAEPREIEQQGFMLMFTDATSGKESYPATRYLDTEGKTAGSIWVDFNKAYSPPCNYSPVFTCPLPRPQNRLPVAVEAGQKWFQKGEPPNAQRSSAANATPEGYAFRFAVQVGAHATEAEALRQAGEVSALIGDQLNVMPAVVDGRTYYRVRLLVRTRAEAEELAERLLREHAIKSWTVRVE